MTEETQGQESEIDADVSQTQGEAPEPEEATEAEQVEDNAVADESEEPELSVEERLEKIEKDNQYKEKAIHRKTAALHEANRKIRELQSELQKFAQSKESEKPEPNIDDFETHDEYVNAVADYRAEQRVKQKEQEFKMRQMQEAQQKQVQERLAMRQKQEAEYITDNPQYEASSKEVADYLGTMQVSDDVANAVLDQVYSGNVPAIIDYFGKNNGENLSKLDEIMRMPAHMAAVEVYKLQQAIGKPEKKAEKPLPKPVKTKPSNAGGKKYIDDSNSVLKSLGVKGY